MEELMGTRWMVNTYGDPLGAVQRLIQSVWSYSKLDGMLVATNGDGEAAKTPHLLEDAAELSRVNPFKPVMPVNTARLVPETLEGRLGARLGVLLRPCELRALIEMGKHAHLRLDSLLTINVDCLGTYPLEEYHWRTRRKVSGAVTKTPDDLNRETLHFARQGGIARYRFRPACQVCESPGAENADLNFNVFGLPVRQAILVQVRDEAAAARLGLRFMDGLRVLGEDPIDVEMVRQHERILAKAVERHQHTMERINKGLGDMLPRDVDGLIEQLESCGSCRACMNVCPICSVHSPLRDADGHYQRESVIRWLVSCAGCGMCEQACPNHRPLGAIFGYIRNMLDEELGYIPGKSLEEVLPNLW
jgi:formate dehydrogenase subunit beta